MVGTLGCMSAATWLCSGKGNDCCARSDWEGIVATSYGEAGLVRPRAGIGSHDARNELR
jgi:hypothetical protein